MGDEGKKYPRIPVAKTVAEVHEVRSVAKTVFFDPRTVTAETGEVRSGADRPRTAVMGESDVVEAEPDPVAGPPEGPRSAPEPRSESWAPAAASMAVLAVAYVMVTVWIVPTRTVLSFGPKVEVIRESDQPLDLAPDDLVDGLSAAGQARAGRARFFVRREGPQSLALVGWGDRPAAESLWFELSRRSDGSLPGCSRAWLEFAGSPPRLEARRVRLDCSKAP
jgi:hypothetical protein